MKNLFVIIISGIFLFFGGIAGASEVVANPQYSIHLDYETIKKGYTVSAFNNNENKEGLSLSLTPGVLSDSTKVEITQLNEEMEEPWNLKRISKIYQFEFKNKEAYENDIPFYIQFSYGAEDDYYKQVYFYDKNYNSWRPLPTRDFPEEKFVRSLIHLPFARIAVFSYPKILTVGKASWYKYKGGNFAASPDFPKGSILRVYASNPNGEKANFVDVEINDYGPDRAAHPDRVIDLDKEAFSRIAFLSDGIADIYVEALYVANKYEDTVLGEAKVLGASETVSSAPHIKSKAALIINEKTGATIFEKNGSAVLPLASLTKLVAVKVFNELNSDLGRVVSYSLEDEKKNELYCSKIRSARLKLEDGETVKVRDLIYISLIGSTNNTIETLVRVSGLSRDDFIKKMNKKVKELGANSTSFEEPTGLSANNVTTVKDYAMIMKEVLKDPVIAEATVMSSYNFYGINTEVFHSRKNTDKLLTNGNLGITGSKTGFLDEAGYCLALRTEKEGKKLITVILGAETRNQSFEESEELIAYGRKQ